MASGPTGTAAGAAGAETAGAETAGGGPAAAVVRADATGGGGDETGRAAAALAVFGSATAPLGALAVSPRSGGAVIAGAAAASVRSRESSESAVETRGDARSQAAKPKAATNGAILKHLLMYVMVRTILVLDGVAPCPERRHP